MKESEFWTKIRNGTKNITNLFWQRIENAIDSGTPDASCTYLGKTIFIELKVVDSNNNITFRPAQIVWMENFINAGGKVFILALKDKNIIKIEYSSVINQLASFHPTKRKLKLDEEVFFEEFKFPINYLELLGSMFV